MDADGISQASDERDGRGAEKQSRPKNYTEVFNNVFPYYLAIGMTYEQFWEEDCCLVIAYRKAFEIKRELNNQAAWLQGMYIYDALCCVAPLLRAFSKRTKPTPYVEKPYALGMQGAQSEKTEGEQGYERAMSKMQAIMTRINKRFDEKGGASRE